LRQQAGIPGLALAIVRNGRLVDEWVKGYGLATLATADPVLADTPFAIADLSQTIAATLVLRYCIDRGEAELGDQVRRWSPLFPEAATTFAQLLSHNGSGGYHFERSRYKWLTAAAEECGDQPYPRLVYDDIMTRLAMTSPVPGGDVRPGSGSVVRLIFPIPTIREFNSTLDRMATPYRVDSSRRASPSNYQVPTLDASNGFVASVRDIASFEAALDGESLLSSRMREQAWQPRFGGPMGYGWFVQQAYGKKIVWHFGLEPNAFSSLVIKVPNEGLTLILLANSDALTAPFRRDLESGDVTVSPFAKIFLSLLG
jgi:CubicO group peptidase (beta-lactamase class C family)